MTLPTHLTENTKDLDTLKRCTKIPVDVLATFSWFKGIKHAITIPHNIDCDVFAESALGYPPASAASKLQTVIVISEGGYTIINMPILESIQLTDISDWIIERNRTQKLGNRPPNPFA